MKLNNKGFMMAEVVVVSSVILIALSTLYTSYNKLFSSYNKVLAYYDVPTLYRLAYIKKNSPSYKQNKFTDIQSGENVYYNESFSNLAIEELDNKTYKEYVEYLKNSVTIKTSDIFIIEKCDTDGKSNCKYAYLEGYNETS